MCAGMGAWCGVPVMFATFMRSSVGRSTWYPTVIPAPGSCPGQATRSGEPGSMARRSPNSSPAALAATSHHGPRVKPGVTEHVRQVLPLTGDPFAAHEARRAAAGVEPAPFVRGRRTRSCGTATDLATLACRVSPKPGRGAAGGVTGAGAAVIPAKAEGHRAGIHGARSVRRATGNARRNAAPWAPDQVRGDGGRMMGKAAREARSDGAGRGAWLLR